MLRRAYTRVQEKLTVLPSSPDSNHIAHVERILGEFVRHGYAPETLGTLAASVDDPALRGKIKDFEVLLAA